MEKIEFKAGTEERFKEFISNLKEDDKIALLSHVADLDGISAAKVSNHFLKTKYLRFVDYEELNENLIEELRKERIEKAVLTDLMIKEESFVKKLEEFCEVLIIDHHLFSVDYNSDKTVFMNAEGYCAAYLCYYLFSKVDEKLDELDWLAACASVSDWCYSKNSEWMTGIYEKYGEEFVGTIGGIQKSKFFDLVNVLTMAILYFRPNVEKVLDSMGTNFGEIGDLKDYSDIVKKEVDDKIKDFEENKIVYGENYFYEFESKFPIKSIVSTSISASVLDKTVILAERRDDKFFISVRRQDGKVDMNILLQKLVDGFEDSSAGGHFKASGGYFPVKYLEEFKKRLESL